MAKKGQLIGFKRCMDAGHVQAEVRLDKNGHPYCVCFECDPPSQDFTYGRPAKLARFVREGFKPAEGQALPEWAKPAGDPPAPPAPGKVTAPPPEPKKKLTLMG